VISGILFLLILSGCGSSRPSRFYTLYPIGGQEAENRSVPSVYNISVAIGPVDIPDYLDRPQIVSRTSQNELTMSEFDRWAGSLKDDIARVLSENLTRLLSQNSVFVSPWEWGYASDYRITVDIGRFDIMPEGNVLLSARWTIIGKGGMKVLLTQESIVTEPITAPTYEKRVSSMSGALEKLSRDTAEGIKAVIQKNK
jgi:uncharacterized lipoprotein YmbA